MSGHSKWASIKHKKGALDAKRGKIFSKIGKEIEVASKTGSDPGMNPRLRLILQKARDNNMPNDIITRAIKKGTGELGGVIYEEMVYEGYGPGGVAMLIHTLSDNKNRTGGEVRSTLDKKGGNLGSPGAVGYLFSKRGYITVDASTVAEDKLMDIALEAGALDFATEDGSYAITTEPQDYEKVLNAVRAGGIITTSAEVTMLPSTTVKLAGAEAQRALDLVEALEDLEDVQNVYANFDISEEDLNA
jgi:YebC/PmpR family DNA-binding regulatory protein